MYTVIRHYTSAPSLAGELTKRAKDIETVISGVPGFIAYYLIKTSDGVAAVTVCESQKGCDESSKRAADWLRQNLPNLKIAAPQVITGEAVLRFATYKTTGV
jgi:hypothetical protein